MNFPEQQQSINVCSGTIETTRTYRFHSCAVPVDICLVSKKRCIVDWWRRCSKQTGDEGNTPRPLPLYGLERQTEVFFEPESILESDLRCCSLQCWRSVDGNGELLKRDEINSANGRRFETSRRNTMNHQKESLPHDQPDVVTASK